MKGRTPILLKSAIMKKTGKLYGIGLKSRVAHGRLLHFLEDQ